MITVYLIFVQHSIPSRWLSG